MARRSRGTPSCTAATTPATAPRSSRRAGQRCAPWLSGRCGGTGKLSCPPVFESALSARPAPWLASPLQAPPRSTPNLPHSAAQALDTPGPPFPPRAANPVLSVPQARPAPPKPTLLQGDTKGPRGGSPQLLISSVVPSVPSVALAQTMHTANRCQRQTGGATNTLLSDHYVRDCWVRDEWVNGTR